MRCDQCAKDSTGGRSQEWVAGRIASRQTYSTGTAIVGQTSYSDFAPISTFLCDECYEPRARKARRNVWLSVVFGIVGIGLLVLAYLLLFVFASPPPLWRNLSGVLAALIGFLLAKTAWSELTVRGELLWKSGARMELHDVFHPYALKQAKEIGRDTVWDPQTYKTLSGMQEVERLAYLWEKGTITQDEYQEKKKQILGG